MAELHIMMAEIRLMRPSDDFFTATRPVTCPRMTKTKNHIHETATHAMPKANLSGQEVYMRALPPITANVSMSACGLSNDTDAANLICLLATMR